MESTGTAQAAEVRAAAVRPLVAIVAAAELVWSVFFYVRPDLALGALDRVVLDAVIARQYPLYLASVALAYALAAIDPRRYVGIVWLCVAQRVVEFACAFADWRAHAIPTSIFAQLSALEIGIAVALSLLAPGRPPAPANGAPKPAPADRGLVRLLWAFGGLEVFWFLASTVFVQIGARLLNWKLQDPYTTQQQGIALLVIGVTSLLAASDIARYRIFVWVPIASQLIGIGNAFNEIRLGSIGWPVAAIQWTIESAIVAAFVYFSRDHVAAARQGQMAKRARA
jgi:hypothetical protein